MKNKRKNYQSLRSLRMIGVLEGISFLVILFITMPLKYFWHTKEPNWIVGMVHGCLFLAYCILVLITAYHLKWKISVIFFALLASIIPFGTFIADKKIFREEQNL